MDFKKLTQSEIERAMIDIKLLKTLKSPTILKFMESIETNDKLTLIFEYAPKGSLHSMITKRQHENRPFSTE